METFETFEALYNKAIFYGEIEPAEGKYSKVVKDALNSINQSFYEREFWIWLQKKKEFNPEKGSIQPFLTEENWIEFFREHTKQAEAAHADYLNKQADRKRKIDSEEVPQMPLVPPDGIAKPKIEEEKIELKISIPEIALYYAWEWKASGKIIRWIIDSENKVEIAASYGWNSKTSGHKLYSVFGHYKKDINRTGDTGSLRKLENRKVLFEKVIPKLSEKAKSLAESELVKVEELLEIYSK